MPSALANYYAAMAADHEAAAGLTQQRTQTERLQGNEIGANAAAARGLQYAQTGVDNANAATIPGLAQSEIGLRGAQASLTNAQATALPTTTLSENALRGAQAGNFGADTQRTLLGNTLYSPDQIQALVQQLRNPYGSPLGAAGAGTVTNKNSSVIGGAEKGTSKVKASGDNGKPGKTDTVPMMLAPGEAVLNRGAAEHLGGGVVDHLNKLGMMRMAAQEEVAGHAKALAGHSMSKVMKQHAKNAKRAAGNKAA